MVVDLHICLCPHDGTYMLSHPDHPQFFLKCPQCGFTRPQISNYQYATIADLKAKLKTKVPTK